MAQRLAPVTPGALLIEGPAAIGKSTLWRAGVALAASSDRTVLRAASVVPDLPARQRHALRVALLLEPPVGVPPGTRAIATAVPGAIGLAARQRPLVLAIDDAAAAALDDASRRVLDFVIRRSTTRQFACCAVPPSDATRVSRRQSFSPSSTRLCTVNACADDGYNTPEEAAVGDVPRRFALVVGTRLEGRGATVWLLTNEAPRFEPYQVECVRRDGRWRSESGSGGFMTGTPAEVKDQARRLGWSG